MSPARSPALTAYLDQPGPGPVRAPLFADGQIVNACSLALDRYRNDHSLRAAHVKAARAQLNFAKRRLIERGRLPQELSPSAAEAGLPRQWVVVINDLLVGAMRSHAAELQAAIDVCVPATAAVPADPYLLIA